MTVGGEGAGGRRGRVMNEGRRKERDGVEE